jgi:hypothetical protein
MYGQLKPTYLTLDVTIPRHGIRETFRKVAELAGETSLPTSFVGDTIGSPCSPEEVWVSEAYARELESREDLEVLRPAEPMHFNEHGQLVPLPAPRSSGRAQPPVVRRLPYAEMLYTAFHPHRPCGPRSTSYARNVLPTPLLPPPAPAFRLSCMRTALPAITRRPRHHATPDSPSQRQTKLHRAISQEPLRGETISRSRYAKSSSHAARNPRRRSRC